VTAYGKNGSQAGTSGTTDSLGNAFIDGLTAGTTYYAQGSNSDDSQLTKYIEVKPASTSLIDTSGSGQLADTVSLTITVKDDSSSPSPITDTSVTVTATLD